MIEKDYEIGEEVIVDCVTVFNDEQERWGHRRNPLAYPYSDTWFAMIPKEDRHKYGIRLKWKELPRSRTQVS